MARKMVAALAALGIMAAGAAQARPGDPMVSLLGSRPIPERAIIVQLRDPDGEAVWPVPAEIVFEHGPAKKVTLGREGLYVPIAARRPVAIRLDAGRFGAGWLRYPIDAAADGGVRITLRYVPD